MTKESKLKQVRSRITKKHSLHFVLRKDSEKFQKDSNNEGKGTLPIMTYDDYIIYLKGDHLTLPKIPLSKFNYSSGTFEKKWGPEHKTIVLMPNYSCIRKVEIEIQGMNIHKMKLLPDKDGDILEDTAKVKITRHYRFSEGAGENRKDSSSASPGTTKASKFPGQRTAKKFR